MSTIATSPSVSKRTSESQKQQRLASRVAVQAARTPPARDARTLKVLVVDDCPFQQLFSSLLLSRWGIQPQIASDGIEAVLMANERQFDLILMDIRMDGLDGVQATARIRQNERRRRTPSVPVVAYTAEPVATTDVAWAEAGISASLSKPCEPALMRECLEQWCGVRFDEFHD